MHVKFNHGLFDCLEVIGQVDKKFIATLAHVESSQEDFPQRRRRQDVMDDDHDSPSQHNPNENSNSEKNLLILFDQHAVHERIRLEKLMQEHFPNRECVKSGPVNPEAVGQELRLKLSPSDGYIVKHYKEKHFVKFGLDFELTRDADDEEDDDAAGEGVVLMVVSRVPACFILREENDLRNFRPSPLLKLTRSLVEDITQAIKRTRGGGLALLPKTIHYVLCSRACRGAVKFGDRLSFDRCVQLLEDLGKCKLPFQCAHGRPSLAPIVDKRQLGVGGKPTASNVANAVNSHQPKKAKLNFQRLKEQNCAALHNS